MNARVTAFDPVKELLIFPLILLLCSVQSVTGDLSFSARLICPVETGTLPRGYVTGMMVSIVFSRSQGFLNANFYLRTRAVWQEIKEYYSQRANMLRHSLLVN